MFLTTVVSDFTRRFILAEKSGVVLLVMLTCYLYAVFMVVRLVGKLQRGETDFGPSFYRWILGLLFVVFFPNFLSVLVLRTPLTRVLTAGGTVAGVEAVVAESDSGYFQPGELTRWQEAIQGEMGSHANVTYENLGGAAHPDLRDDSPYLTEQEVRERYGLYSREELDYPY